MKTWIIITAIAAGISSLVFAQENGDNPDKGPRIACDEPVFDFGSADNTGSISHTFVLKNTGDTTLEISNIRAACGCTVANISTRSIPPGGTSELTANLNLRGRNGKQSKGITITSNDPQNPSFVVTLVGTATTAITLSTERIMFGELNAGQETSMPLEIRTVDNVSMNITGIETGNDAISVQQQTGEDGVTRLNIAMKTPAQPGAFQSNIKVMTDHPARPVIDIPVFANILGQIIYAPQEIALPADAGGVSLTRYIVLRPGSAGAFEVSNVELPAPGMTHQILPFGSQGYRIQIDNIVPDASLNDAMIRITTTASASPVIEIPLRVTN
ncbi:MAG: DUF1573 domain-containing protein [Kiritimatiellia bacterium]